MHTSMAFVMLVVSSIALAQEQSAAAPRLLRSQELRVSVDPAALQRQYNALLGMSLEAIEYSPRGPISNVVGQTGIVLPANTSQREKGDSATDLLPLFDDLLLAAGTESLTVRNNFVMYGTERGLELSQSIRGIPVVNGVGSMSYNADTKRVSGIVAHFVPDRDLPPATKLSAEQAKEVVRQALESMEGSKVHFTEGTYLAYFAEFADPSPPQLVWAMRAVSASSDEMFYVDSATGLVVARTPMSFWISRKLYDLNNSVLPPFPQGLPAELTQNQINSQLYRSTPYNFVEDADDILRLRILNSIPEFPTSMNIVVRYGLQIDSTRYRFSGGKDYITLNGAQSGSHIHAGPSDDVVVHEFSHAIAGRTLSCGGRY